MTGDVIKSFLVGLGFGVDDASLAKFNKAISGAALKVTALYAATKAAAAGIVYGISKISEGFEQMGYEYRIIAPAINKALMLRRELLKAYSAAGINITKVVQASVKLNYSLAKTRFAFEAIYKSVASKFFDLITKQSDLFRQRIYANMPRIQHTLENLVKFVFKALEATTALGVRLWSILQRVYDFFVTLDRETQGWSTIILGVVAAWKLLNLEFLATPLGMIIAGLVTILALFDDFKTWQEKGKSLFDWAPFVPVIDAVADALSRVYGVLQAIADVMAGVVLSFLQLFRRDFSGSLDSLKNAFYGVLSVAEKFWETLKSILGVGGAFGGFLDSLNLFGNATNNLQNGVVPLVNPLSSQPQNSLTNQHVQQQTNINVNSTADANSVGRAVAGQQTRVNFDMVRNLRGSVR